MAEKSIKQLLEEKQYDLLLVLELEAERLHPDRTPPTLIGQFVLLYDLIPQSDFSTMLVEIGELRQYFGKFLKQEKGIELRPSLRYLHWWGFDKIHKGNQAYYFINSKNKMGILDEVTKG